MLPASVGGYGLGMPKTKRPAPGDADTARQMLLSGLARDAGLADLLGEAERLHSRNDTFPGEIFLALADALAWCGAGDDRSAPTADLGARGKG